LAWRYLQVAVDLWTGQVWQRWSARLVSYGAAIGTIRARAPRHVLNAHASIPADNRVRFHKQFV